jgi:hypothetical protein
MKLAQTAEQHKDRLLLFLVDAYAKLQLRKFKSRNIISLIVSLIILSPFVNYISNIYP